MSQPTLCEVCYLAFPEGEGGYGDICPHCGWEIDSLEDCREAAAWCVSQGYCTEDESKVSLSNCLCHLNGGVLGRLCGSSDANHESLSDARRAWIARR